MPSRYPLLIALALAAAVAGGCADGKVKEVNAYVHALNAAQASFTKTSDALFRSFQPSADTKRNRTMLQRASAVVDTLTAELRRIKPPTQVQTLHRRLITTTMTFGSSLRRVEAAAASGNVGDILDAQQDLPAAVSTFSKSFDATLTEINDALRT